MKVYVTRIQHRDVCEVNMVSISSYDLKVSELDRDGVESREGD